MSARNFNLEIRKLNPSELYGLANILNVSNAWKKLMAIVPNEKNTPKFNNEHIIMIEQGALQFNRNAAEIFLEEWGTMGKQRPTLQTLMDLLVKAELFRAADYIAHNILRMEIPKRPNYGPAASIDVSDTALNNLLSELETSRDTACLMQESTKLIDNKITHNFDNGDNANIDTSNVISNLMSFREISSLSDNKLPVPLNIKKYSSNAGEDKNDIYRKHEELPSSDLPVFLNTTEEVPSDNIPIFLNTTEVSDESVSSFSNSSSST